MRRMVRIRRGDLGPTRQSESGGVSIKAAVVRSFAEPLVVEERPVPTPAGHQVLVRMETSGLCRTDIHAAQGDWPVKPSPPFV